MRTHSHVLRLALTLLAAALLAACGDSNPAGPSVGIGSGSGGGSGSGSNRTLSARIDNGTWTATTGVTASLAGGVLSVSGADPTYSLAFTVAATTAGTYVIPGPAGVQGGNNAVLTEFQAGAGNAAWTANATGGTGAVMITSLSTSAVSGTFSFLMVPSSTSASDTRSITNGTFSIAF
jgi:hypothetical protein